MSNLKELTKKEHTLAEKQDFVKVILSRKIHPNFYGVYLYNQYLRYNKLEELAEKKGIFDDLNNIKRARRIYRDYQESYSLPNKPPVMDSVNRYLDHLDNISDNSQALMANIYVLHSGDLSGGQILARMVPGSGRMYQFDGDVDKLKEQIKKKTCDEMADEARLTFGYSTELIKDLIKLNMPHYRDPKNGNSVDSAILDILLD